MKDLNLDHGGLKLKIPQNGVIISPWFEFDEWVSQPTIPRWISVLQTWIVEDETLPLKLRAFHISGRKYELIVFIKDAGGTSRRCCTLEKRRKFKRQLIC